MDGIISLGVAIALVLGGPVVDMLAPSCSNPTDVLLIVSQMLWQQDYLMSEPWLPGTADRPVTVNGTRVWEANPLVAGHPEQVLPFIQAGLYTARRVQACLPAAMSVPLVLGSLANHWLVIADNQRFRERIGVGRLWAVGWAWTF